jgi:hypothetical protein
MSHSLRSQIVAHRADILSDTRSVTSAPYHEGFDSNYKPVNEY